jgi:hypothetical protein
LHHNSLLRVACPCLTKLMCAGKMFDFISPSACELKLAVEGNHQMRGILYVWTDDGIRFKDMQSEFEVTAALKLYGATMLTRALEGLEHFVHRECKQNDARVIKLMLEHGKVQHMPVQCVDEEVEGLRDLGQVLDRARVTQVEDIYSQVNVFLMPILEIMEECMMVQKQRRQLLITMQEIEDDVGEMEMIRDAQLKLMSSEWWRARAWAVQKMNELGKELVDAASAMRTVLRREELSIDSESDESICCE